MTKKPDEDYCGFDETGKRNMFSKKMDTWSKYDFDGKVSDLIVKLQTIEAQASKMGYTQVKIESDTTYDYYDTTSIEFTIYALRVETDEELVERKAAEERHRKSVRASAYKRKKEKLEAEKALYDKLHEKYGDKTKLDVAS